MGAKVSVIIPVYNVEQYIERCARSLFEQTLDDIEYIFVNDCTPDKSMEVLARVLDDYPARKRQVSIINMPVNGGLPKVRRAGVEAATGDYIIHCDSDDWVDVTMYEKMWRKAVTEDLDMVICGNFETDGETVLKTDLNDFAGFKSIRHAIIADKIRNYLCNKLIRRELYDYVEEWPVYNVWEDTATACQIAYHCKTIGKIDEPLYYYFVNNNGICAISTRKEISIQQKANFDIVINHIRRYGGEKRFRKELMHRKCSIKMNCWNLPWRVYLSIYPETNLYSFFDSDISLVKRIRHLTKCLGILGIIKKTISHMPSRTDFSDGTSFQSVAAPELSVVLPVYNAEKFLRESIDSILSQTFKDFELIIINDGSTDSSEQIVQSYTDSRIVYLKNDVNLKLIATLNRGINAARGRYIARIDADDRCHPSRFEQQVKFLDSHKDIDFCGTWANIIGLRGEKTGRIRNAGNPGLLSCLLFFTCPLLHPSIMGRSSVFKENGYDSEMLHVEDFELWNRLSRKGIRFANIPQYLIDYRWHGSNISVLNDDEQFESKLRVLQPQVSELLEREVSRDEMLLHIFSFNLYSKGRNCAEDCQVSKLTAEKEWLIGLSEANDRKSMFPETDFHSVVLSRWAVCCIAFGKYFHILSLPARFYRPRVIVKAFILLLQK